MKSFYIKCGQSNPKDLAGFHQLVATQVAAMIFQVHLFTLFEGPSVVSVDLSKKKNTPVFPVGFICCQMVLHINFS